MTTNPVRCLCSAFALFGMLLTASTSGQTAQRSQFARDDASGVRFWNVGNVTVTTGPWKQRIIVVFLEKHSCSLESVTSIFRRLSERYHSEDYLTMVATSDTKERDLQSQWLADLQANGSDTVRGGCPLGTEPPTPSAQYFRSDISEYIVYYPSKGRSVHVDLSPPRERCSLSDDAILDLIDAARVGCENILKLILGRGVKPDTKSKYGGNALVEAAIAGQDRVLVTLLDAGADINQTSGAGWTALMCAIGLDRSAAADLLLIRGADVNLASHDGRTPLIVAVRREVMEVVKKLLARGADPNIRDHHGETALSIAMKQPNEDIVRLLRSAGAK